MKKLFYWLIIMAMLVVNGYNFYNMTTVMIPVEIVDHELKIIKGIMTVFNVPQQVAKTFYSHGKLKDVDPILLAAIAVPESQQNPDAVSPRGYTGRMQSSKVKLPDEVEMLNATHKFVDFMKMANDDTNLALRMYNGGTNPHVYNSGECKAYANKVLAIYQGAKAKIERI